MRGLGNGLRSVSKTARKLLIRYALKFLFAICERLAEPPTKKLQASRKKHFPSSFWRLACLGGSRADVKQSLSLFFRAGGTHLQPNVENRKQEFRFSDALKCQGTSFPNATACRYAGVRSACGSSVNLIDSPRHECQSETVLRWPTQRAMPCRHVPVLAPDALYRTISSQVERGVLAS